MTKAIFLLKLLPHLDLCVASFQQADGELNALLKDLLVLRTGYEVYEEFGATFFVQTTL